MRIERARERSNMTFFTVRSLYRRSWDHPSPPPPAFSGSEGSFFARALAHRPKPHRPTHPPANTARNPHPIGVTTVHGFPSSLTETQSVSMYSLIIVSGGRRGGATTMAQKLAVMATAEAARSHLGPEGSATTP